MTWGILLAILIVLPPFAMATYEEAREPASLRAASWFLASMLVSVLALLALAFLGGS